LRLSRVALGLRLLQVRYRKETTARKRGYRTKRYPSVLEVFNDLPNLLRWRRREEEASLVTKPDTRTLAPLRRPASRIGGTTGEKKLDASYEMLHSGKGS
jgi:hypothetical protein